MSLLENIFFYHLFCLQHYSLVNSLQWHPYTGWLLSASTDRGIIVWKPNESGKKLIPSLCNIKEQKSNLDAAWNTRGDKFCVGATSGHVFIGTWDEAVQFWVAVSVTEEPPLGKPLHKASVMSVRFDPGASRVVASASADGMVYVTSCYDPDFDLEGTGPFAAVTAERGEILFKFKSSVWNNTLNFSPSGKTLAFACKFNREKVLTGFFCVF